MGDMNQKMARLVKDELGSVKVMILAIMMSFGVVLAICNFMVNTLSSLEMANGIKEYLQSPYDYSMNNTISMTIKVSMIMQIVMFIITFIPVILMAFGIYLIYANSKSDFQKTTGLKVTGGVFKYHGIVSFIVVALIVIGAIALIVISFAFGDKIVSIFGTDDPTLLASIRVVSLVVAIAAGIMAIIYAAIGVVYMSLSGNMKSMSDIVLNKGVKRLSAFGIFVMILAGANNIFSAFSNVSSVGLSVEDIEMLEETLGGTVAEFVMDIMPSTTTQYEAMVVSCAYAFFIGAAQIIAGFILFSIRSKVNRALQEQEYVNYGGDNFISGN